MKQENSEFYLPNISICNGLCQVLKITFTIYNKQAANEKVINCIKNLNSQKAESLTIIFN